MIAAAGRRLLCALLAALAAAGARAGGGGFDADDGNNDSRATMFGFVKDQAGDPVADAKVTVTMTKINTTLELRSDPQGHFVTKLFYRDVAPTDVELSCAKDGYRQVARTRRPSLAAGAPIEIDCVLGRP